VIAGEYRASRNRYMRTYYGAQSTMVLDLSLRAYDRLRTTRTFGARHADDWRSQVVAMTDLSRYR
jgi:hypothetical protein